MNESIRSICHILFSSSHMSSHKIIAGEAFRARHYSFYSSTKVDCLIPLQNHLIAKGTLLSRSINTPGRIGAIVGLQVSAQADEHASPT